MLALSLLRPHYFFTISLIILELSQNSSIPFSPLFLYSISLCNSLVSILLILCRMAVKEDRSCYSKSSHCFEPFKGEEGAKRELQNCRSFFLHFLLTDSHTGHTPIIFRSVLKFLLLRTHCILSSFHLSLMPGVQGGGNYKW